MDIQAQQHQARILNGIKGGLEFLIDDAVIGPIKYAESLSDLKWILRGLLAGQFSINLDAQRVLEPKPEEAKPEEEKTGANGEGA